MPPRTKNAGEKQDLKRKRREPKQETMDVLFSRKFHHCVKEVKQAAKKAKTFEVQKQVKRLRSLRQKDEDAEAVAAAEAQLVALKDIDSDLLAVHALQTKLNKDRMLSTHEDVKTAASAHLSSFSPVASTSAVGVVQSRILSSKILASEIVRILGELRKIVFPMPAEDAASDAEGADETIAGPIFTNTQPSEDQESDEDVDDEGDGDGDGWESGTVQDTDLEAEEQEEINKKRASHVAMLDEESDDPAPPKKQKVSLSKPTARGESTFLPSLAVGFTRGDSDSEWSDSEAKVADGERKNRRGQRARRAIWEKKYGRNATHVKKERDIQADRRKSKPRTAQPADSGWPKRTGAPPGRGGPAPRAAPGHRPPTSASGPRFAPHSFQPKAGVQPQGRPTYDDKPLHPSWEAKKKQAEKSKFGIMQHTGTKIKFTD